MRRFFLLFFLLFGVLQAAPFKEVPSSVQKEVALLTRFPETKALLDRIEKEGPITIKWLSLGQNNSNALFSFQERVLGLNSSIRWSEGELLYSILFELVNADSGKELIELDRLASKLQIAKPQYVEAVERVEYSNTLKVSNLMRRGVQLGYFPKNLRIPTYPPFNEHLMMQRQTGHSGYVALKYDQLNRFPTPEYLR